ncbi:unnamed protein product [Amoebophrya sp. A25]|nr:unnamed protein product [Amoebophrya sp. A25]|eukprot:GSA25T00007906001.1
MSCGFPSSGPVYRYGAWAGARELSQDEEEAWKQCPRSTDEIAEILNHRPPPRTAPYAFETPDVLARGCLTTLASAFTAARDARSLLDPRWLCPESRTPAS